MQRRDTFGRVAHTKATMVLAKGCTEPSMTAILSSGVRLLGARAWVRTQDPQLAKCDPPRNK